MCKFLTYTALSLEKKVYLNTGYTIIYLTNNLYYMVKALQHVHV